MKLLKENKIIIDQLNKKLINYKKSFDTKINEKDKVNRIHDPLMDIYGITPLEKKKSAQYWGRQLGLLWERLVRATFRISSKSTGNAKHIRVPDPDDSSRTTSPADLASNGYGIDTKYRVGSGDSKFNKQFETNYKLVKKQGLKPVLLILRTDNLHQDMNAAKEAGWIVLRGKQSFEFIKKQTGFNLLNYLYKNRNKFNIND